MKKILLVALLFIITSAGNATAQNQTHYGGKKGDFSVSFNIANTLSSTAGYAISGAYMLSDRWMIFTDVAFDGYDMLTNNGSSFSMNDETTNNNYSYDKSRHSIEFSLGASYLLRPTERVQAYVGGELTVERSFSYSKYDYEQEDSNNHDNEYLSKNMYYGMGVVFGADYFITPRVAVGGRIGLSAFLVDELNAGVTSDSDATSQSGKHTYGVKFTTNNNSILLSFYF